MHIVLFILLYIWVKACDISLSIPHILDPEDQQPKADDDKRRPSRAPPAAGLSSSVSSGSSYEHGGGEALAPAPGEHHWHVSGGGRPSAQSSPHASPPYVIIN